MSNKIVAMIEILNKIDSGQVLTPKSLARDLEVTERSVFRYVQQLQAAGFMIYFDKIQLRYRFEEGFSLKKPHLNVDETLVLSLAKRSLAAFGPGMLERLGSIENKIAKKKGQIPQHFFIPPHELSPDVERCISLLHQAIDNFKRVQIIYRSAHASNKTQRKVDPYYLFLNEGLWYLRCYCHLRDNLRTLALDRILEIMVLDEGFASKIIDPEKEFSDGFGNWMGNQPEVIVLRFDREAIPYILRKKWHKSQTEKTLPDGRLEVSFMLGGIGALKKWIFSWVPFVEVIQPDYLRKEIRNALSLSLRKHSSASINKQYEGKKCK